jgi:predicted DNA binding CopG/RHH family protein
MSRQVPIFKTDEEAEAFLDQDLSDLDFSQFKRVHFEFSKKSAQVNMRLPEALLDAVKKRSEQRGVPYTRFIREAIEQAISNPENVIKTK